jgi:Tfp pilus assembly protein PilZ
VQDSDRLISKWDVFARLLYRLNDLSEAQQLTLLKDLVGEDISNFLIKRIIDLNDDQRQALLNQISDLCLEAEAEAMERRKHQRKDCLINADLSVQVPRVNNFILNLNSGGAFVETTETYTKGQDLRMTFFSPQTRKPLSITGQVVWTNSRGAGVKFQRLTESQLDSLKSFSDTLEEVVEISS